MTGPAAAFYLADGERFIATTHTQGPWRTGYQHAGPPSALLARAVERAVADDPALVVTRMALDLLAPIPVAPCEVAVKVVRAGRKARRLDATLTTGGVAVIRATAMALRTSPLDTAPDDKPAAQPEPPESGEPYVFPVVLGVPVGYTAAIEVRRVAGATQEGGVAAWIRSRVSLVAGEAPSPLQRVLIAADSGNGLAVPVDPRRYTFPNADLVVALHRPLEGEWVCLDAATAWNASGIGLTQTRLRDRRGLVGVALQTLLIEPRA